MLIFWVIIVSLLMMGLFIVATIAGGQAHDRRNREEAGKDAETRK
ncbi:hypothetical protein [Sphingomonas sp.]